MEHKEQLLGLFPTNKGYELFPNEDYEIKQEGEKFYLIKKKKEYPKTYEECCKVLGVSEQFIVTNLTNKEVNLYGAFICLIRCRDAYWKIAGEEMGGKPWEPDLENEDETKWVIFNLQNKIKLATRDVVNAILAFPTEEIRDVFYDNFKGLIEFCKELL